MKFSAFALSFIVAALLTACGDNVFEGNGTGTDGTGSDDKGSNLNSISAFDISSFGGVVGGVTSIISGSEFSLTWTVTSSNPYDFEVSIGASLSDPNLEIFHSGTGECKTNNCPATKTFKCNLIKNQGVGSDYSLNCAGGGSLIVDSINFADLRSIVLQICNQTTQDCATKSVVVSLGV